MVDYTVAVLGVSVLFLLVVSGVLWGLDWLAKTIRETLGLL